MHCSTDTSRASQNMPVAGPHQPSPIIIDGSRFTAELDIAEIICCVKYSFVIISLLFLFTCKMLDFCSDLYFIQRPVFVGMCVCVFTCLCACVCFTYERSLFLYCEAEGDPVLWHSVVFCLFVFSKRDYIDTEQIFMTLTNFCQKALTHKWDGKRASGPNGQILLLLFYHSVLSTTQTYWLF